MTGVCLASGIGRVSWIEALGPEPCGDCDGDMYHVLGTEADLCERHLLQYHHAGRKFSAARRTDDGGAS